MAKMAKIMANLPDEPKAEEPGGAPQEETKPMAKADQVIQALVAVGLLRDDKDYHRMREWPDASTHSYIDEVFKTHCDDKPVQEVDRGAFVVVSKEGYKFRVIDKGGEFYSRYVDDVDWLKKNEEGKFKVVPCTMQMVEEPLDVYAKKFIESRKLKLARLLKEAEK